MYPKKLYILLTLVIFCFLSSCNEDKKKENLASLSENKPSSALDNSKKETSNKILNQDKTDPSEEIASELLNNLKNKQYKEVEDYFDKAINTKEKTKDGIHISGQVYEKLGANYWNSEIDIFNDWCNASSHHSAFVTRGIYHIHDAWRARGTGLARNVSSEHFALFRQRLSLAQNDLENAYQRKQNDPNIANKMLVVIRGLSLGNEMREIWFERGKTADPSFLWLYQNKLTSIYPKWGGSWKESYDYCKELYENPPHDSLAYILMLDLIMESSTYSDTRGKLISYYDIDQYVKNIEARYFSEFPDGDLISIKKERIRGGISFMENRPDEAEISFKKIIEIDPNYDWAWYMLGQMYQKSLHKPKEAVDYFNKAIELQREEGIYYNERGFAYRDLRMFKECIPDLEFSIKKGYQNYETYLSLANCYGSSGDYENGIINATKSMKYKEAWYPLWLRATFYQNKGDLENAIADCQQILMKFPDNKLAIDKLSALKAELDRKKK